jgi:hypothetical protein
MSSRTIKAAHLVSREARSQGFRTGNARKEGTGYSIFQCQGLLTFFFELAFRHGKHIELSDLPLTATPGDLRRAIDRVGLKGVQDCKFSEMILSISMTVFFTVALLYTSFRPTGTALISLKGPDTLKENLRLLDNALMSGIPLKAQPLMLNNADTMLPRARGDKGREEAATRGALRGNGPHAGISNGGKNVTIWGFPGKTGAASVEYIVRDFNLDRKKNGLASVYKIHLYVLTSPFSKPITLL